MAFRFSERFIDGVCIDGDVGFDRLSIEWTTVMIGLFGGFVLDEIGRW